MNKNSIYATEVNISMSVVQRLLEVKVGEQLYDISTLVPEDVWGVGIENNVDPYKDWEMRKKLRIIFIKWFKENIDPTLDEDKVVF